MTFNITPPVHPGEYLGAEYLEPLSMTPYALAKKLHVPRTRIERLASNKTSMTPDTALRMAKYFQTTPEFWLNLQSNYDLALVIIEKSPDIDAIEVMQAA